MARAQGPTGANGTRSADDGLGRLAGWCCGDRCRVPAALTAGKGAVAPGAQHKGR
jgi:hypothetical protein